MVQERDPRWFGLTGSRGLAFIVCPPNPSFLFSGPQLIPRRLDWEGKEHRRSFEDLVSKLFISTYPNSFSTPSPPCSPNPKRPRSTPQPTRLLSSLVEPRRDCPFPLRSRRKGTLPSPLPRFFPPQNFEECELFIKCAVLWIVNMLQTSGKTHCRGKRERNQGVILGHVPGTDASQWERW